MTQNKSNEVSDENKDFEKRNSLIGTAEILVGCGAVVGAMEGIDTYEARLPSDALASINYGDNGAFVTYADLGFAVLGGAGIAVVAHGLHKVMRRSR